MEEERLYEIEDIRKNVIQSRLKKFWFLALTFGSIFDDTIVS